MESIPQFSWLSPTWVLAFVFVLTVIVFFHELGHFLVARWCGVKVKVFSVGFGPELIGWTARSGTRWRVSAIPLGGYVKFLGDQNAASAPDRDAAARMDADEYAHSFAAKNVGQRAAIVAAGPIANFILAILIFAAIFAVYGRQVTTPRVDSVTPGSAAEAAGFQAGDLVVAIDGAPIETFADLQRIVTISAGRTLAVTVERAGARVNLTATPEQKEQTDRFGNVHRIGMLGIGRSATNADIVTQRFSVPEAIWLGTQETWFVVERTVGYIAGVVSGRESPDQIGGPIRVAQVSGQVALLGFLALVNLAAILSVSIGLINLFPIPLLDGGHLLYFAVEAVRGKPLSERAQEMGFRLGLALVILLMLFATWNDILHLAGS
jgi:regulator of sigma E protease